MTILAIYIQRAGRNFKADGIKSIALYNDEIQMVANGPHEIKKSLEDPSIMKVFHDAIADISFLKSVGINVINYTDTMTMAQMLEGSSLKQYSLRSVTERFIGQKSERISDFKSAQQEISVEKLENPIVLQDAKRIYLLYQHLIYLIEDRRLDNVYHREKAVIPALVEVTMNGMLFDYDGWSDELCKMRQEADLLREAIQQVFPMKQLNLHSPYQLKQALNSVGVKVVDVSNDALAQVEHLHPIIANIRKWKNFQQRLSTFGEKFKAKIDEDGRIRGNWSQIGTATGRMSCSQPPLQGMPSQSRSYFKAAPGNVFIVADYAAIELRVLAYVAVEAQLLKVFQEKKDPHLVTASSVFNIPEKQVTDEQRQVAKVINFGIIYGMSANGLQRRLTSILQRTVTLEEAEKYRQSYFRSHPNVLAYQDRMLRASYISTLGGREFGFYVPPLPLGSVKRYNYPIQSAAADGFKEALVLLMSKKPSNYRLVHLIHDEIIVEVPQKEAEVASQFIKEAMIEGMNRIIPHIPIEIDCFIKNTWG